MTTKYGPAFYNLIRAGVQASAAVMVPIVLEALHPDPDPDIPFRVVDVGCGEGWWANTFADAGCQVIGIDGSYVQGSPLGDRFLPHDLRQPLPKHLTGRFDLAVCLEVAEHLPATRADSLVTDLCGLAPLVLFSAAIPGQGGVDHVNEQEPVYWVRRFQALNYTASGGLRWKVWDHPDVDNWYKANTLIFARNPKLYPKLFKTPLAHPWHVIHPVLFDARRG